MSINVLLIRNKQGKPCYWNLPKIPFCSEQRVYRWSFSFFFFFLSFGFPPHNKKKQRWMILQREKEMVLKNKRAKVRFNDDKHKESRDSIVVVVFSPNVAWKQNKKKHVKINPKKKKKKTKRLKTIISPCLVFNASLHSTRDLSDGFTVVKFHKQGNEMVGWKGFKTVKRERDSYTIYSCDIVTVA